METVCSGLRDQISGYELFKEQYEVVQDEQVKVLSDRVAGLDAELIGVALHLDEEFYPYFLTTIAGRRWIISRGFRLAVMKCLQSPEYVAALGTAIGLAIDKGIQTRLAAGIDHGRAGRSLTEVAAYDTSKDASIADIMSLLHLEGPSVGTLEGGYFILPLTGSVPPISVSDYDAVPHAEAPPSTTIVFEKEELETTL
ncbi:hypothetical protein Tco_1332277 [Tanacetum coccineum]